jgi:signal transduction histidine kinase
MSGHVVPQQLGSEASPSIRPKSVPVGRKAWEWISNARKNWADLTLSTKFAIASCIAIATAMALTGAWVDHRLKTSVVDNAAMASARVIERVVQSHVQDLNTASPINDEAKRVLANLISDHALGHRILQIKLWRLDGSLAYSSNSAGASNHPVIAAELRSALSGHVVHHFDDRHNDPSSPPSSNQPSKFEVYAPLYKTGTRELIGVGEFYEDATNLHRAIAEARHQSWLVVGLLTLGMLGALFSIVNRGSTLIIQQRNALEATIEQQSVLLAQNEFLQADNKQAHIECAQLSDKIMRRVGADLHDGPAQLLGLALLRLDELKPRADQPNSTEAISTRDALDAVRGATQDALREIRSISAGVALPDCEVKSTTELIQAAVQNHERRTKTRVQSTLTALPDRLPPQVSVCIYRFVQEGLFNAARHAQGRGQTVTAYADDDTVTVTVSDTGPGFDPKAMPTREDALGLAGLRHRVDLLGGVFRIQSTPGLGTTLTAVIPREANR